ncbi:MAG: UDP-N-acetylhexosamine pyrophosphorylase [Isosphaera sp.]|nr:UDP-N-acetylhexosamine pyrophosphorylase [Isosphaera sp.]
MTDVPTDLLDRLRAHGQDHVLAGWQDLPRARRAAFVAQLSAVDLAELAALAARAHDAHPPPTDLAPIPVAPADPSPADLARGEEALRRGEVAALMVAGGQGSRLGFDKPKGMYPVGPVSGATLFQLHAEKILALGRRYGKPVPFLVMTSPATDGDTRDYFREHRFFGLRPSDVIFFQQGTMPAVDAATGRLLLEEPGKLFLSPNGHGGTLTALAECGVLAELKTRGVRHVYYFQVDNPLLKVCDPGFVGRHVAADSEASSKVVFKEKPEEKVGVFAVVGGRCGLIEYSDLPKDLAAAREPDGTLRFRAGSPAIHLFSLAFLDRVTSTGGLPYHVARKAVPYWDPEALATVAPTTPNALKFERFVFDALPLADRWLAVEARRAEEFAPLKNASGADSAETVRAALVAEHARWLAAAGVRTGGHPVEVSPLFALDADALKRQIPAGFQVTGPTHLR